MAVEKFSREQYAGLLEDEHARTKAVRTTRTSEVPEVPEVPATSEVPEVPEVPETTRREPNAEQLQAIQAPVNSAIRVLAPPGSGKTFLLEHRNLFLIENGVSPDRILNVTFSKPMADAGRERVVKTIRKRFPNLDLAEFECWYCTIHAMCYRMLKSDGDRREVPPDWKIKKAIQEISEGLWPYAQERPGWREVYHWICAPKQVGLTSAEDLNFYLGALPTMPHHARRLHEARRQFDNWAAREKVITFPDMLFDVEQKLLHDSVFRAKWQAKFEVINLDEAQDTNGQAMRILNILAAPQDQVCIVGDTDQLLYRFTGATPEANLYNGFEERYQNGTMVKLRCNYRSTRAIIRACDRLISHNYGDGAPYDEKYRKGITWRDNAPEGVPVSFRVYDDPDAEARAVASAILEQLVTRQPGDIFVAARTRAQLGYLEGPLVRAGIKFVNITGGSFWTSGHVANLIAYLRLALNECDNTSFKRVYNIASCRFVHPWGERKGEYCQHRYLGAAFLQACEERYTGVWNAVRRRGSFEPGVRDLTTFISNVRNEIAKGGHVAALQFILDECLIQWLRAEEGLEATDEAENWKLEDLATVIDVASQFQNVSEFLSYVDDLVKATEAAADKDWSRHVVVSTVHCLKGQERPVVFGVGLAQGLLPHRFAFEPPPQMGVLPVGDMARLEDERDICYVLVSRAMEECHLSAPCRYRGRRLVVSQFISEMGIEVDTE